MAYFRCFGCNKIWTKLEDDGCINCRTPCEVLHWDPEPRRISAYSNGVENHLNDNPEHVESQTQLDFRTALKSVDYDRPRRLFDFDIGGRLVKPRDDHQTNHSNSTSSSVIGLAGSRPRRLSNDSDLSSTTETSSLDSSDSGTALSARLEESLQATQIEQRTRQDSLKHEKHESNVHITCTDDERTVPATQPLTSILPSKKSNEKVSKNASKNASKRRRSTGIENKPKAQLELPDPIPLPKARATEQAWNQVLSKQAAKRSAKLEVAAHKGREINASPSLMRRLYEDENEFPSARTARFGLRGAKHDVKSTVPREIFEFESFY